MVNAEKETVYLANFWNDSIEAFIPEKETEHFYFIEGKRLAKVTESEKFFESFQAAKDALISAQLKGIDTAAERLKRITRLEEEEGEGDAV